MTFNIKKLTPYILAVVTLLLITVFNFSPQLSGKVIPQGDIKQHRGMSKEITDFKEETGERALWTNALFGGMPSYQINGIKDGNLLKVVADGLGFFMKRPIKYFFTAAFCMFLLLIGLKVNPWLAALGGFLFAFPTNTLVLYEAGHTSKVYSLAFLPLIILGVVSVYNKKHILGGIVYAIGLGVTIMANHIQMTYYFGLTLIIAGIVYFIYSILQKDLASFLKSSGVLVFATVLAVGANTSNLLPTYEYSKDTMRGKPILKKEDSQAKDLNNSSETQGLAWNYAMRWSNSSLDLVAAMIPGFVGGSSQEKLSKESASIKAFKKKGYRTNKNLRVPLYWGKLQGTSGPQYLGAITIFLFILGLLVVKHPLKWWMSFGLLLIALLSLGIHFSGLNKLFFDYFPMYNKFRAPSSIMSIAPLLVSVLGILGLHTIITNKDEQNKKRHIKSLYIASGITAGLCLLFYLLAGSLFSFEGLSDAQSAQYFPEDALIDDRLALLKKDALRSFLFILLASSMCWLYIKKNINAMICIGVIALFALIDLSGINKRYLSSDDFIKPKKTTLGFEKRKVDEYILSKEKSRGDYRVLDFSTNTFNSNHTSFFHNSVGGYHAAKLQRYQDMIEYHIQPNMQKVIANAKKATNALEVQNSLKGLDVLNMLNTKYVIFQAEGSPIVNPNAFGNAWFVKNIKQVSSPKEEINSLSGISLKENAIVNDEFKDYISSLAGLPSNSTIKLTSYEPNHLTYEANTNKEALAIFSEVWYGENKGWNAYVDGKLTDHIRANYILRGLKIPSGNHTIEFKFEPKSYKFGSILSYTCSILLLVGICFIAYLAITKKTVLHNE